MTLRDMHMTETELPVNLHTSHDDANPKSRSEPVNLYTLSARANHDMTATVFQHTVSPGFGGLLSPGQRTI